MVYLINHSCVKYNININIFNNRILRGVIKWASLHLFFFIFNILVFINISIQISNCDSREFVIGIFPLYIPTKISRPMILNH